MVGGVTGANGQSRSLQLRESNDDKRMSRQIGFFLRSNLRSPFSLVWKLWRWHPSGLAFWMLLAFLSWCCFVATLKYSNSTCLVACYVCVRLLNLRLVWAGDRVCAGGVAASRRHRAARLLIPAIPNVASIRRL